MDRLSNNTQVPNLMKIRPVGTELYADAETYDEASSHFSQWAWKGNIKTK